jgi:hypothetical protein
MRPTAAMTDAIVKIMIEILSILAIVTEEIKHSRSSESTDIHKLLFMPLLTVSRNFPEEVTRQEQY